MAEVNVEMPRHVAYYQQAKQLAMGVHPLSKYVPPLLLLADALLTSLVISKVACKLPMRLLRGHLVMRQLQIPI